MVSEYFTRKREQSRRPSLALPHDERPALCLGTRKETRRKRKKKLSIEKFYEKEKEIFEISEKPETRIFREENFCGGILFVYLFTYRFHISFVISTVCVIFQGYDMQF